MTMEEALHALSLAMYSGAPIPVDTLSEVQTGLNSEATENISELTSRVVGLEGSAGLEPGKSLVYTREEIDAKLAELTEKQTAAEAKADALEKKQTALEEARKADGETVARIKTTVDSLPERVHVAQISIGSTEDQYLLGMSRMSVGEDGKYASIDTEYPEHVIIYPATDKSAGIMTAADKKALDDLLEKVQTLQTEFQALKAKVDGQHPD